MAVKNFQKLPLSEQLRVVKRVNNGEPLKETVDRLTVDNPIISVWRNGKIKIYN